LEEEGHAVKRLVNVVRQLRRRRDGGASAVEYGLLVALIAVVIAGAVTALGIALNTKLGNAAACVDASADTACPDGAGSGE
jgi:pilus assembly protein Flp/PilA